MGRDSRLRLVPKPAVTPEPVVVVDDELARVLAFANAVQGETHWQRILESAESDEIRDELRKVVEPHLPWRRTVRCHSPECESGLRPIWQPVLVVRATAQHDPSWAPIEMRLCEQCKTEATVDDFLTDHVWSQIVVQCAVNNEPTPWRPLTRLMWDRVQ